MLRVLLVISPRATSGHTLGSGMLLSCRESRSVGRAEACKHWNQCPPGASLNFRSREAGLQRQAAARRPRCSLLTYRNGYARRSRLAIGPEGLQQSANVIL